MASVTDICNRALQKLGAARITSISQETTTARACAVAYPSVRQAELRAHPWSFAVTRTALAADATAPAFGKAYSYTLPALYLRLLAPYPEQNLSDLDWEVEGRQIFTNASAPLNVRYVQDITDTAVMDALFVEALASKMALELCEELTQSNSKKESCRTDYKDAIREAKKTNAIEKISALPPEDSWVTVRS